MTSAADTTQHPDVSEISDLTEGILPPSRTADLRRHLESCALCADVRTSLEEIRGLLGTLPGAARMPADIAERIDAALAAEALLDATAPQEPRRSNDVSRETAVPEPRPSRVSAPSAGARRPAATETLDRPAGRPAAATGPGRGPSPRRRRRRAVLSAVCGLAVAGLGFVFFRGVLAAEDPGAVRQSDSAAAHSAAAPFSGVPLSDKVRQLLTAQESAAVDEAPRLQPGAQTEGESGNTTMRNVPPLPSCVQKGIGRSEQPLVSERGEYEGSAAYLVLLPQPGDPSQVDVYVVDAACTVADSGTTSTGSAEVLLRQTAPRP
ncbi:hypothetical protein I3F58_04245 [Streptomyces sp. MUM 203J]|uniref:hypothetical protein n=1 Tax=Streptomyces sp. MUM 203J TaxID=2791990 RepID=UPI001F04B608|nr:hypothetical protein [Streptomyces sp. MUM 203J]MCH0538778.1 hypothetical protein [Streptomyces sp. MUM 203J]